MTATRSPVPTGWPGGASSGPGSYLVVEVSAPPGYDLPDPDTMPVVITDPGTFVPGGEMATLLFRDIAQGQLTITKQQWEKSGDAWVASDGVVAHGDLVKYTLHVETQGLKRFHDVTVRDYVPNHNPDDTTSTGTASLVADSAVCVQVVCTVDVADGLITWHLGDPRGGRRRRRVRGPLPEASRAARRTTRTTSSAPCSGTRRTSTGSR